MESSKSESTDYAEIDSALSAYYNVYPLGGPRRGAEPVLDALMIALRDAIRRQQNASADAQRARYNLQQAEGEQRDAEALISAFWTEIRSRTPATGERADAK